MVGNWDASIEKRREWGSKGTFCRWKLPESPLAWWEDGRNGDYGWGTGAKGKWVIATKGTKDCLWDEAGGRWSWLIPGRRLVIFYWGIYPATKHDTIFHWENGRDIKKINSRAGTDGNEQIFKNLCGKPDIANIECYLVPPKMKSQVFHKTKDYERRTAIMDEIKEYMQWCFEMSKEMAIKVRKQADNTFVLQCVIYGRLGDVSDFMDDLRIIMDHQKALKTSTKATDIEIIYRNILLADKGAEVSAEDKELMMSSHRVPEASDLNSDNHLDLQDHIDTQ